MPVINEGEILARIHKFKLFRKEGNLFIDLYEALMGEPASKFIAVPNLIIQEAAKEYFGFGDTKAEALKDCLKKIKDVPIQDIVQPDEDLEMGKNRIRHGSSGRQFRRPSKTRLRRSGKIYGTVLDSSRPDGAMDDLITARETNPRGMPVKNAKVTAVCKGAGKEKTRTDDSGYYELTGLQDGVWSLKIKARGYEEQEATVKIEGGGEYEENFS